MITKVGLKTRHTAYTFDNVLLIPFRVTTGVELFNIMREIFDYVYVYHNGGYSFRTPSREIMTETIGTIKKYNLPKTNLKEYMISSGGGVCTTVDGSGIIIINNVDDFISEREERIPEDSLETFIGYFPSINYHPIYKEYILEVEV
jgi:hypothetical protein